jgi:hypothetical protein
MTPGEREALRCYVNLRSERGDGCGLRLNRALRRGSHTVPARPDARVALLDAAIGRGPGGASLGRRPPS